MRHRAVRRVHGACRWSAGSILQRPGGHGRRQKNHDDRRALAGWQPSDPARLERIRYASVRLVPVRGDHARARPAAATPQPFRRRYQRRGNERLPLRDLPPRPPGYPLSRRPDEGREAIMSENGISGINRREFLAMVAAAEGAFILGFWVPPRANAQTAPRAVWYEESTTREINAWIVISANDTVTIRIAQSELGQGVWTSNAMMVCEELQCDWTKVRPQYASANRDAREKAPAWTLAVPGNGATDPRGGGVPTFGTRDRTGVAGIPDSLYRRMRTNAASSVKDGRYYLQLAGAEARERLLLAAARSWGVPVEEVSSANSVITHRPTGRTVTYGQVASLAAQTPHPEPRRIRIKPPSEWTLMGTEQKNLDVP